VASGAGKGGDWRFLLASRQFRRLFSDKSKKSKLSGWLGGFWGYLVTLLIFNVAFFIQTTGSIRRRRIKVKGMRVTSPTQRVSAYFNLHSSLLCWIWFIKVLSFAKYFERE
jgi:hypothetical protein